MLKPVIDVDKVIKAMQVQYLGLDFKPIKWTHSLGIGLFLNTGNEEHKLQTRSTLCSLIN